MPCKHDVEALADPAGKRHTREVNDRRRHVPNQTIRVSKTDDITGTRDHRRQPALVLRSRSFAHHLQESRHPNSGHQQDEQPGTAPHHKRHQWNVAADLQHDHGGQHCGHHRLQHQRVLDLRVCHTRRNLGGAGAAAVAQGNADHDIGNGPQRIGPGAGLITGPERTDGVTHNVQAEGDQQQHEGGRATARSGHQAGSNGDKRDIERRPTEAREPVDGGCLGATKDRLVQRAPHHSGYRDPNGGGVEPPELMARCGLGSDQRHQSPQLDDVATEEDHIDNRSGRGSHLQRHADEVDQLTKGGDRETRGQRRPRHPLARLIATDAIDTQRNRRDGDENEQNLGRRRTGQGEVDRAGGEPSEQISAPKARMLVHPSTSFDQRRKQSAVSARNLNIGHRTRP